MSAAARDDSVERQINLIFALLSAYRSGNALSSGSWLRKVVTGYQGISEDAARKRFSRDIKMLRTAGVPIEIIESGGIQHYRLKPELYELPEINFTPEEAAVLGLAGDLGRSGELGSFSRSGWTKLAASGVRRELNSAPQTVVASYNDLARIRAAVLLPIIAAIQRKQALELQYRPSPIKEAITRRIDPWGVVTVLDRLYLVGWDIDRQAPRSYRLLRLTSTKTTNIPISHEYTEDPAGLAEIVKASLEKSLHKTNAKVQLKPGKAAEIRLRASSISETGIAELHQVERDWLVRTCASFGEYAVVLEPADIRAEVIALLKHSTLKNTAKGGKK
ncbi:helix-turn-helix transcriptional regulator [Corynebacterium caspium]|uniref:helix-turn-helix transcriptional regulator n=1 Tax=Corynebacterium caspium TaxID=234828 RepID=UPI00036E7004|nr:WYL domain-containing protein [Corynebacterium caspium]WKD59303.1 hypothetical protein CCASP_04535 [Corynebacterium caspium DSM 44850]